MLKSSYHPDDIVTIAEARERMGEKSTTRDAFHKAIYRGKLKKLPDKAESHDVRLRWGDILEYVAAGGFKKCSPKSANASDSVTSFELDEEALSTVTDLSCIVTGGADTFIDQGPAEAISVEVLPKETDAECHSELDEVERLVIVLPTLNEEDLIKHIKNFTGRAKELANEAVAKGMRALICAWACGTMLNKVKANCQHGKFTLWLAEHLDSLGISSRSCQRYMKLAHAWPRLCDLVQSQPGIRDAYIACGILQEPAKPPEEAEKSGIGDTAQGSDHPSLAKPLMSCAAALQKLLRDFAASGEVLTAGDMNKLGEVMDDLRGLYGQLQEQTNEMNQSAA